MQPDKVKTRLRVLFRRHPVFFCLYLQVAATLALAEIRPTLVRC